MRNSLIILGILDDSDIDWLVANGRAITCETGDLVIRQGEPVDALFFLLEGTLRIVLARKDGEPRELAVLYPGEIIGEISLLDSRPPTASVEATERSLVFRVERATLDRRLERDKGAQARLYRALGVYLAQRMRRTILTLGGEDPDDSSEDIDEIDPAVMEDMSMASARFSHLVERVQN